MKRPKSNRLEGTTPALSDEQARALLSAPQGGSLKARRDRAILATLAYHGMRREELCKLKVRDLQRRDGVLQLRIAGKGEKIRYVPVGIKALRLITEYWEAARHKEDMEGPLFRPVQNRVPENRENRCIRYWSIQTLSPAACSQRRTCHGACLT